MTVTAEVRGLTTLLAGLAVNTTMVCQVEENYD